jgi:TIR domain-containing protein
MTPVDAPTIFISHSAKEAEAASVLEALEGDLTDAGFAPWLDRQRLAEQPGVVWRQEIAKALHMCRGAVVLLSPSALESPWVRKETTILAHRHDIAPSFRVLPLLVAGVGPEDLSSADWEPIAISELQALVIEQLALPARPIVDTLRPLLDRHAPDSRERRLENYLVKLLSSVNDATLDSAAHELELQLSDWDFDADRPTAYARRLLQVPIELQTTSLDLIADADPDLACEVFTAVAPHGWIAAEATAAVRAAADQPAGRRGLGLNTAETTTCEMYVRAGFFDWQAWPVEGAFSERAGAEIVDRARASLLAWLGDLDAAEMDVEKIDETIDETIEAAATVLPFVVLPPETRPSDVAELRRLWPHLPLMVRCHDETEGDFVQRSLEHVTYLRPPVDPTRESTVLKLSRTWLRTQELRARRRGR